MNGIQSILTAIDALARLVGVGRHVLADGRVTFGDIPALLGAAGELVRLVTAIPRAIGEITDLDSKEAAQVGQYLVSALLGK